MSSVVFRPENVDSLTPSLKKRAGMSCKISRTTEGRHLVIFPDGFIAWIEGNDTVTTPGFKVEVRDNQMPSRSETIPSIQTKTGDLKVPPFIPYKVPPQVASQPTRENTIAPLTQTKTPFTNTFSLADKVSIDTQEEPKSKGGRPSKKKKDQDHV